MIAIACVRPPLNEEKTEHKDLWITTSLHCDIVHLESISQICKASGMRFHSCVFRSTERRFAIGQIYLFQCCKTSAFCTDQQSKRIFIFIFYKVASLTFIITYHSKCIRFNIKQDWRSPVYSGRLRYICWNPDWLGRQTPAHGYFLA